MAKLPDDPTLDWVFTLQRQCLQLINTARVTELLLFELYGETEATFSDFEAIQNVIDRLQNSYTRLHAILLRIAEAQPNAPTAMLELLEATIVETEGNVAAAQASTGEIQKDWNLP